MSKQKGFTLIELLVVISIIGVLSSVVLAAVNTARSKGNVAAGQTFANHTRSALFDNRVFYADFNDGVTAGAITTSSNYGTAGGTLTTDTTNGATVTADTDLYKNGKQLVVTSSSNPIGVAMSTASGAIHTAASSFNYAISVWFKPNYNGASPAESPVVGIAADGNGGTTGIYATGMSGSFGIVGRMPNGGSAINTSAVTMKDGQWMNIVYSVVKTSGTTAKANLYINGVSVASSASQTVSMNNGQNTIVLGGTTIAATRVLGTIDEPALYNTYLTAYDAKEIYARGLATHTVADAQ